MATTSNCEDDLQAEYINVQNTKDENMELFLGEIDSASTSRCPIFTFVKNITRSNEDRINTWKTSWFHFGFQPYVLTEKDALSRPEYGLLLSKVPSMEHSAGYMRWLALSSVQGGLFIDSDVLPLGGDTFAFSEYQKENCHVPEELYISEEFGFKAFLASQASVKRVVKQLCSEAFLKGLDSVWLGLKTKEYQIKRIKERYQLFDASDSVYLQKHKKSIVGLSPSQLKSSLIRANYMNRYSVKMLHSEEANVGSAVEASLIRALQCPTADIKYDRERILPNYPFVCNVSQVESMKGIDITGSDGVRDLYLVFVHRPIGRESQLLKRLFPGVDSGKISGSLKAMIKSQQVIFIPMDQETDRLYRFLEYKLGFLLDRLPNFSNTVQLESDEGGELENEVYEMVVNYFKTEYSKMIEFEYD